MALMGNKPFFQANIHSPGTGVALIVIAITLIPVGVASLAQLSCFGRPSSDLDFRTVSISIEFSFEYRVIMLIGGSFAQMEKPHTWAL